MLFVLCYPAFSSATAEAIETFRKRHEPQRAQLVRAHVTLVFGVQSISPENLIAQTTAVAEAAAPFEITLDESRIHNDPVHAEYKLFLLVQQGREELAALHRHLYSDPLTSERKADIPFEPHITVATATSLAPIQLAKSENSALGLPIKGRIDALEVAGLKKGELVSLAEVRL